MTDHRQCAACKGTETLRCRACKGTGRRNTCGTGCTSADCTDLCDSCEGTGSGLCLTVVLMHYAVGEPWPWSAAACGRTREAGDANRVVETNDDPAKVGCPDCLDAMRGDPQFFRRRYGRLPANRAELFGEESVT